MLVLVSFVLHFIATHSQHGSAELL